MDKQIENELKLLNEVTAYERSERAKIKNSLKNFHEAVDEREAEIKNALNQRHQSELDEQNAQAEKLKVAVLNNDADGIENFLKQIQKSN